MTKRIPDPDSSKGATEGDINQQPGNPGMQGQLGHRDEDPILKDADSDFPEPGLNPEHSGEPEDRSSSSSEAK